MSDALSGANSPVSLNTKPMHTTSTRPSSSVKRKHGRFGFTILLALTTSLTFMPVYSAGLLFLHDAPARFFNDKDWRILKKAVNHTLEEVPDGETSVWQNKATGSKGVLKPVKTYQHQGTKCRTLKILNEAAGRTGESVFDFCQQAHDRWKLAP
jgi:hypothetical protein